MRITKKQFTAAGLTVLLLGSAAGSPLCAPRYGGGARHRELTTPPHDHWIMAITADGTPFHRSRSGFQTLVVGKAYVIRVATYQNYEPGFDPKNFRISLKFAEIQNRALYNTRSLRLTILESPLVEVTPRSGYDGHYATFKVRFLSLPAGSPSTAIAIAKKGAETDVTQTFYVVPARR